MKKYFAIIISLILILCLDMSSAFANDTQPTVHEANAKGVYYVIPPKNFDPLHATNAELKKYHFPLRPKKKGLAAWKNAMKHYKKFIAPIMKPLPGKSASIKNSKFNNWAGYEGTGANATAVTGQWQIPDVSSSTVDNSYSCSWIGIGDGNASNYGLIQMGTESDYVNSHTNYYTWYQIGGGPNNYQTEIGTGVSPGDQMYSSISYDTSTGQANFYLEDMTTGGTTTFYKDASSYYDGTKVEWIIERTKHNGSLPPLANFQTAYFYNSIFTNNGTQYTPGQWASNHTLLKDNMYDDNYTNLLAQTNQLYQDTNPQDSFTVSFVKAQ